MSWKHELLPENDQSAPHLQSLLQPTELQCSRFRRHPFLGILTQNCIRDAWLYTCICHTLATSLTSREARCRKCGLSCPVCTLIYIYTQLASYVKQNGQSQEPRPSSGLLLARWQRSSPHLPVLAPSEPVVTHSLCPPKELQQNQTKTLFTSNVSLLLGQI